MSVAAQVAQHKEKHPEKYCPEKRCLWRTGGGYCPRHAPREAHPRSVETVLCKFVAAHQVVTECQ